MKENSSIWDLLAKRTDHSLSKEEVEALEHAAKKYLLCSVLLSWWMTHW